MSKEYIGREEAILAVRHAWAKGLEPTQYIEQIPAADVVPVVHGQWIGIDSSFWKPTHSGDISVFRKTYRCPPAEAAIITRAVSHWKNSGRR